MKIKLSKRNWEAMGRKAGWMKKAQSAFTGYSPEQRPYLNTLETYREFLSDGDAIWLPKDWHVEIVLGENGKPPFLHISSGNSGFVFDVPEKTFFEMMEDMHFDKEKILGDIAKQKEHDRREIAEYEDGGKLKPRTKI